MGPWVPSNWTFLVTCSVPLYLLSYPNSYLSPITSFIGPPSIKVATSGNYYHSGFSFSFPPAIPLLALFVLSFCPFSYCFLACRLTIPTYGCSVPPSPKTQYPSSLLNMSKTGRVLAYTLLLPVGRNSVYAYACIHARICTHVCRQNNCVFVLVCIVRKGIATI